MNPSPQTTAEFIQSKTPHTPLFGLVLGSGLGALADALEDATVFDYQDLPGFPESSVAGHSGRLLIGLLSGKPVVCLQGRAHVYETPDNLAKTTFMIRTLKCLGVHSLFLTNASGSFHEEVPPGALMVISDHINFSFHNPLVGPNDDTFGPRFSPMQDAYNAAYRKHLKTIAKTHNIPLHEGVYIGVLGPCFETPAEIRAFRMMGADAVGMSTVPEVIVARHCDLKVIAVAAITNLAADIHQTPLSHEETLENGQKAARALQTLIQEFIATVEA